MAFLLKRRDGRDIAKNRYCPVQNGTYGQPINNATALQTREDRQIAQKAKRIAHEQGKILKLKMLRTDWSLILQEKWENLRLPSGISQVGDKNEKTLAVAGDRRHNLFLKQETDDVPANTTGPAFHLT
jgi:hypothetical protein